MNTVSDTAVRYKNVTLAELLDRVLDKGVTVDGDIYLSVACYLACLLAQLSCQPR